MNSKQFSTFEFEKGIVILAKFIKFNIKKYSSVFNNWLIYHIPFLGMIF